MELIFVDYIGKKNDMFRVQLIFDVVKISIFQNFVLREIDHQSYCQ